MGLDQDTYKNLYNEKTEALVQAGREFVRNRRDAAYARRVSLA